MVPRIAKAGTSFKGASLYYLHDKNANTSERVAWSQVLNATTDEPDRALRYMAAVAMKSEKLKQAAGVRVGGRQSKTPVYCYSLSWHPSETPTRQDMEKAARESLRVLGMDNLQAVLVAHNDEPHPHVHVIVNRIDPTNGKTASNSNDRLNLSKWAEAYDRARGKDHCPERRANNARRTNGDYVRHKTDRTLWRRAKTQEARKGHEAESSRLWDRQKADRRREYVSIDRQKKEAIEALRAEYKPQWRSLYQGQRETRQAAERLNKRLGGRLHLVVTRGKDLGLKAGDVFRPKVIMKAIENRLAQERQPLSDRQKRAYRAAYRSFDHLKSEMKAEQKAERETLREKQRNGLSALWEQQRTGADQGEFQAFEKETRKKRRDFRESLVKSFGQEVVEKAEKEAERRSKEDRLQKDRGRKLER